MSEIKQTYEHKDLKPNILSILLGTEALRIIPQSDADSIDVSIIVVEKKIDKTNTP